MKNLSLAKVVLDSKAVTFDYPNKEGFKVELTYITTSKYAELRKECMDSKLDNLGYPVESLNTDKWNKLFCEKTISGWSGLTYRIVADLMLIDESAIEDMDEEIPYSVENAEYLLKYSKAFDAWVNARISDMSNFR